MATTFSKNFMVYTSRDQLMDDIIKHVGADCWGCYTQKNQNDDFTNDERFSLINDKHVYFDTIGVCENHANEEEQIRSQQEVIS